LGENAWGTEESHIMAAVLSFVAGLLTVSTAESARNCNGPSVLVAYQYSGLSLQGIAPICSP